MKMSSFRKGCCALTAGLGVLPLSASAKDAWLEVGPAFRMGMQVKVTGSSYARDNAAWHDAQHTGPLTAPGGIGTVGDYGDRSYDNGYVNRDAATGNPASLDPNTTWNWGYQNASQYNSTANTLSYQKTGAPGYVNTVNKSVSTSDDVSGCGIELSGGLPLYDQEGWSVDLCFGFSGVWGSKLRINTSNYSEDLRQIVTTDVYSTAGVAAADFPAAGYSGTYDGPFGTPPAGGTLVPNLPTSRNSVSNHLSTTSNNINFAVDQSIFQFSVGPQIGWAASDKVSFNLRPTVSLNIVDVDVSRNETFGANSAADHGSSTDVFFGMGVIAGVNVDLGRGFYVGVHGGYEWVSETVDVSVGPNTVSFDGSSFVLGAEVGWNF
ncbi:MAG TPA: hypothetical protein VL527_12620 [Dongiaceae bacterium]|nr:hypothetical protein [Dongiaceae bacterium]